ncbi:MAG: HIT domain-containing protein [Clostridia bacterium]|nr:HIT domain-containing protein [Clostridia bacterium]
MKECIFCNIVKTGDNNNEKEKNVILYEDNLLLITQATGSPVRGYLMIVIKRHINGFAELSKEQLKYVEKLINIIKKFYKEYFNIDSILLEHGSTESGRHPQSIVHAHLHLIPFNFNKEIETELFAELHLKPIESFSTIKINEKLDYWLYCDSKGKYYTSSNIINVPRSIFMNLIAKQINLPLPYEWRKSITKKEYIDEMISIFNSNKWLLRNEL